MPVHKSVHLCLSYFIRLFARIIVLQAISVIPPRVPRRIRRHAVQRWRIVRARLDHLMGALDLEHLVCAVKFA